MIGVVAEEYVSPNPIEPERFLWSEVILSAYRGAKRGNVADKMFFQSSIFETISNLLGLDSESIVKELNR